MNPSQNIYTVAVTYEVITEKSAQEADAAERGYEMNATDVCLDKLKDLVLAHNYREPSSSNLFSASRVWISTVDPEYTKDYINNGRQTFYSLHLLKVNGEEPNIEDYADLLRIAQIHCNELNTIGSNLSHDNGPESTENDDTFSP